MGIKIEMMHNLKCCEKATSADSLIVQYTIPVIPSMLH